MRRVLLALGLLAGCHPPVAASSSSSSSTTEGEGSSTTWVLTTTSAGSSHGSSSTASGSTSTGDATATSEATASSDATSESSATTGTTASDTDPDTTGGPADCKKLDLLFLINDGGELWDTEAALEALMPHLADRLEVDFAGWDYHLMVINGTDDWGNDYCEGLCDQGKTCETTPPYPCAYEPSACDQTLGAGLTFPAGGAYAANVPCPIDGDRRYITAGQSDLAGTLDCLRQVGGLNGDPTIPVARATLDALGATLNAPGNCNEGFLRDDAYLILFILSPFPDFVSPGTAALWTEELKAHKGGKFDRIYFIGLYQGCMSSFGWKEYENLTLWTESLYHHALGKACAGDLIQYIDPALDYFLSECPE